MLSVLFAIGRIARPLPFVTAIIGISAGGFVWLKVHDNKVRNELKQEISDATQKEVKRIRKAGHSARRAGSAKRVLRWVRD